MAALFRKGTRIGPALREMGPPRPCCSKAISTQSVVSSVAGVVTLPAGLRCYLVRLCSLPETALLIAAGLGLICPGTLSVARAIGGAALRWTEQRARAVRETHREPTA